MNDNQNIKTNEKQTLNDKFKRTEWQKYEIVSQESSTVNCVLIRER